MCSFIRLYEENASMCMENALYWFLGIAQVTSWLILFFVRGGESLPYELREMPDYANAWIHVAVFWSLNTMLIFNYILSPFFLRYFGYFGKQNIKICHLTY